MSVVPDPPASRVAVIAALDFERASLQSFFEPGRVTLFQAGVGPERAAAAAAAALAGGAVGLVSWGVAGALDPAVHPGALVLPAAVHAAGAASLATDPAWRESLARVLGREFVVHDGTVLSVARVFATPDVKARARAESGAVAVDMESFVIGQVAAAAGVPFVVVRIVLDGARDSLLDVDGLVDPAGNRRRGALLRVVCNPGQWKRAFVLARRFREARAALTRCAAHAAAEAFHYPDAFSSRG